MSVRNFLKRLFAKKCPSAQKPRVRLVLEVLEDRMVPTSQLLWTGSGNWSTAANWTDVLTSAHRTPTSSDQVLFGDGGAGANTNSTMDASFTVDSVVMDSSYTHTLTISTAHTLTTSNSVVQYGTLTLLGTGTIAAGDYIDIYGAVTAPSPGSATTSLLDASGDFFLYSSGSITAVGSGTLQITSANFSDSGTIAVGSPTSVGEIDISGPFTQSAGTITDYSGSLLTFDSLGNASDYPIFQSTVNMDGGAAEIDTDTQLAFSGGTLNATGTGGDIIDDLGAGGGNLRAYNSGTVNVGTSGTSSAAVLNLNTGSLTVGALDPAGSATGGTLNVYTGTTLDLPGAPTSSTFDVTALGVVNMYHATIDMGGVSALDIHVGSGGLANGQLNSLGVSGDTITGSLQNDGSVGFGGATLHTLAISGGYTQSSSGTLSMRLDNSSANDKITAAGSVALDGTLDLTKLSTLSAPQGWTLITAGSNITTDFATKNWPDGGSWSTVPGGGASYSVQKT